MINVTDTGWLTVTKHGRVTPIEHLNDMSYYRALRSFGVSQAAAAAAARGLITIDLKGK